MLLQKGFFLQRPDERPRCGLCGIKVDAAQNAFMFNLTFLVNANQKR